MENYLESDIKFLKGVGEKRANAYKKLGINTIDDLLHHFPRSYLDFTSPVSISDAAHNENVVIQCVITKKLSPSYIRKGLVIYKAVATDYVNDITITIYNSDYMFNKLEVGKTFILYGKITGSLIRKEISSPIIVSDDDNKIQPIYNLTEGLVVSLVRNCVSNALLYFNDTLVETLPKKIVQEHGLCSLQFALQNIHFPTNMQDVDIARKRLIFDELFVLQIGMLMLKKKNNKLVANKMQDVDIKEFTDKLPFELTDAQKNAISDCVKDMSSKYSMNRLVQGDVGSGKTVVAAACCYIAYKNGFQSALMAPTEILANQHFETFKSFLEPLGVNVCLLTGSVSAKEKKQIKEKIKSGGYSVIIGTHAIITDTTIFKNLSFVITDEQHRFGVDQRTSLSKKGNNPHKLVMSATPIPRTLSFIIYGDLDVSILDELPAGRMPVDTYAVTGKLRERAFNFVKQHIEDGEQAYIVCPMIEENENDVKSVTEYAEILSRSSLSEVNIGILHGKLSATKKDKIMQDFKNHKLDLLLSTTVVEVGVDVPNATIMLIENADRFGLSQLHQLRGRVGRGDKKSHCILITDTTKEESKKRLKILASTNDGFKISEKDLAIRGPGDFFGNRQHGLPKFKIADMSQDMDILKLARKSAKDIYEQDKELKLPEHKVIKDLVSKLFEDFGNGIN